MLWQLRDDQAVTSRLKLASQTNFASLLSQRHACYRAVADLYTAHYRSLASLAPDALAFVQQRLFEYFSQEFIGGPAENGVACTSTSPVGDFASGDETQAFLVHCTDPIASADLKNATLHLTTLLFLRAYPSPCPEFFTFFISLIRTYPSTISVPPLATTGQPPLNPQTTDVLLRLLHEVSLEIGDAHLRLNKLPSRLTKDAELRDKMRLKDAGLIAGAVWEVVSEALEGVSGGEEDTSGGKVGVKGSVGRETLEMAIRVVGDYVCELSWAIRRFPRRSVADPFVASSQLGSTSTSWLLPLLSHFFSAPFIFLLPPTCPFEQQPPTLY